MPGTPLTVADQARLRFIERRLSTAFDDLLDLARSKGCKDPVVFVEADCGVYVLDRSHPSYNKAAGIQASKDSIFLYTPNAFKVGTLDTGTW